MNEPDQKRPNLRQLLARFAVKLAISVVVLGVVFGALCAWWASLMGGFSGGK